MKTLTTSRMTATAIKDRELELDVLSTLVIDTASAYKINHLVDDDFYFEDTREIYLILKELVSSTGLADPTLLPNRLKDKKCYLSLFNRYTLSTQLDYHINRLRELSNLRKIQSIAYEATVQASEGREFKEIKAWQISELEKLRVKDKGTSQVSELEGKYDDYLSKRDQPRVETGFRKLDYITNGFLNGSLNVIASAQGIGKTTIALNMVRHICERQNKKVLYISLEMSYLSLYGKFISLLSGLSFSEIMSGRARTSGGWKELEDWQWKEINNSRAKVYEWPVTFMGEEETGTADIGSKLKEIGDIDIVFVDYLQLLKPSKSGSIYETTSATSRELKMLAMKFDIPFVVINSINREYSQRTDFKPHISDLRNSGQLEFDADLVLLLHRPSVFREPKNGENKEEFEHLANLIIAKNRLGEANIELDYHFDGERGRFKEMEKKHAV